MSANSKETVTGAKRVAERSRMSGQARRQQLIEVAIRLFSEKGFRGTTTKEIAAAAHVNEAMIFRHFATKEDLYTAILDYKASQIRVARWLEEFKKIANDKNDEALFRSLATKIIEHHRRDRHFLRLMLYSALEGHQLARNFLEKHVKPIKDFFHDYVAGRQRQGAFRGGNPKAIMQAFLGMVHNHILTMKLFNFDPLRISDQEALKVFVQIFLDGLRHPHRSELKRK